MSLKKYALIAGCLWWAISAGNIVGMQSPQTSVELTQIATIIEKTAKSFGYDLTRGYRPEDEWDADERKNLLDSHAYYTLYGKESDNSCLSIKGRISVTVLIFKDADMARRHIAQRKAYHEGNMALTIIRSNADGFLLKEGNGFYGAVIRGSRVILFEDRSKEQGKVVKSVADALTKKLLNPTVQSAPVVGNSVVPSKDTKVDDQQFDSDEVLLRKADEDIRYLRLDLDYAFRSERRLRELLRRYPDSPLRHQAEERLYKVDETLAEHNLAIAVFYLNKFEKGKSPSLKGSEGRLRAILCQYPCFSGMGEVLTNLVRVYSVNDDGSGARQYLQQFILKRPRDRDYKEACEELERL